MVSSDQTLQSVKRRGFVVPSYLRSLVRRNELGLISLALVIGSLSGALVTAVSFAAEGLHLLFFGVPLEGHVSSLPALRRPLEALIPGFGGLLLGLCGILIQRWRRRRPVDPIEANALHGGRMSLIDSILITGQTVLSNGGGASVGLEAAYTQISSGVASRLGIAFRLRRSDMRTLVGCGSAGAIAAAFGAPLTGAFYGFELIIGTYTPFGLAPIGVAAISGVLVARVLGMPEGFMGEISATPHLTQIDMVLLFCLALICAAVGIGIMRAVTFVEQLFKRSRFPAFFQPVLGGIVVGSLALVTPQVLASGHGALFLLLSHPAPPILFLVLVFFLKAVASAISIGSGFRGGLFFASLFLGALVGQIYALALGLIDPALVPGGSACAIVGMTGLAVAIIGGPLTMSFLALEMTGDVPLSIMMLGAATVVSLVVRQIFGYSFATWRLHLRGESVRGAQDVGWVRALTVRIMMRADVKTAYVDMTIASFRKEFPLGSSQWVIAVDPSDRYVGMILVPDAHLVALDNEAEAEHLSDILRYPDTVLVPEMNIKEAVEIFEQSESEVLAVVDSPTGRLVLGLLTEAHVLRRYTEELDKARRDLAGETWLRE